jgi:hypothetical protein
VRLRLTGELSINQEEYTMANDRDNQNRQDESNASDSSSKEKRVIGKGMTSPDSTQVPLKAETGEPDYDAINGRIPDDENR